MGRRQLASSLVSLSLSVSAVGTCTQGGEALAATGPLPPLQNKYFIVRHGQSKANVAGLICSAPANGLSNAWGLTDYGKQQASEAADRVAELAGGGRLLIYSSDFSRALQTAEIIQAKIDGDVRIAPELRERFFGDLELTKAEGTAPDGDLQGYAKVWFEDRMNASHHFFGVESVNDVFGRATYLIRTLEKFWSNKRILLVSHGDVLQILQCGAASRDLRQHRDFALQTAEVRVLKQVLNSAPGS